MATPAIRLVRRLEGLFCVYKPPGVHWKLVRDAIETNLLKGQISSHLSLYHKPSEILHFNIYLSGLVFKVSRHDGRQVRAVTFRVSFRCQRHASPAASARSSILVAIRRRDRSSHGSDTDGLLCADAVQTPSGYE